MSNLSRANTVEEIMPQIKQLEQEAARAQFNIDSSIEQLEQLGIKENHVVNAEAELDKNELEIVEVEAKIVELRDFIIKSFNDIVEMQQEQA